MWNEVNGQADCSILAAMALPVWASATHGGEAAAEIAACHEEGTIGHSGALGADSSKWSLSDGLFCTFYERQQGA